MTVGIAAGFEEDGSDGVVLAADRMLTVNRASPIEFEHPNTKLKELEHPHVNIVCAASGSSHLIDEFFERISSVLAENPNINEEGDFVSDVNSVKNLASIANNCLNNMVVESINNQVLSHFNTSLNEIKSGDVKDSYTEKFLSEAAERRKEVLKNISILFVGVDSSGSQIYKINNGEVVSMNSLGYASIGSGMQPAQSQFINSSHNGDCNVKEALRTVTAAKMRSEKAQGVGEDTDMYIVTSNDKRELSNSEISDLRDLQNDISDEQENAKEEVLSESEFNINLEEIE